MSLIDSSYFVDELYIPNIDKPEVEEALQRFIDKYEPRFLKDLLGASLYTSFTEGLKVRPVDTMWTYLKSGTTYSINDRTYRFDGLINNQQSIIANYVYCMWIDNNRTTTAGVGEVVNIAENATPANSSYKVVRAWNEMVSQVWQLVSYLDASTATYSNWSLYGNSNGSYYWQGYNHTRLPDIFYPINRMNL